MELSSLGLALASVGFHTNTSSVIAAASKSSGPTSLPRATDDGNLTATTHDTTLPGWGDNPTEHSPASTARPRFTLSVDMSTKFGGAAGGLEGAPCCGASCSVVTGPVADRLIHPPARASAVCWRKVVKLTTFRLPHARECRVLEMSLRGLKIAPTTQQGYA